MSWAYTYRSTEAGGPDPPHFVGRSTDVAYVQALAHDARLGTGSVVAFVGERGVGKTRFLSECARHNQQAAVLPVRCGHALERHQITAQLGGLLNVSLSSVRPYGAAAVESALIARSRRRTVLILVDDLHLATPHEQAMLEWLAGMVRNRGMAIVACVAANPNNAGGTVPSVPQPWRRTRVQTRALNSLDDAATEVLVRSLLHLATLPVATDAIREIVETAQGNPRFAVELVECATASAPLVPASALEMVAEARDHLSDGEFKIVAAASVIDGPFRSEWLADIVRRPVEAVTDALQTTATLGVISEDSQGTYFSFRKAAVRKAFAASLISVKRRTLHQRTADVLSAIDGDAHHAALVAKHYDVLQDDRRAAQWLIRAAEESMSNGELGAAADLYARAARHCAHAPQTLNDVRRRLTVCYRRLGEFVLMIPVLESCLSTRDAASDPEGTGELLIDLFIAHLNNGDRDAAARIAARIEALELTDWSIIANAILAKSLCYAGKLDEAAQCLRRFDLPTIGERPRVNRLVARADIDALHQPLNQTLALIDEAIEIATNLGVKVQAVNSAAAAAEIASRFGDPSQSRIYCNRAWRLVGASTADVTFSMRMVEKERVRLAFLAGNLDETRTLFDALMGWHGAGTHNEAFRASVGVALGMHTGDLAIVDAMFDPALLARCLAKREAESCGLLLHGYFEIMQARGMEGDLRRAIEQCVDEDFVDPYIAIQHRAARLGSAECAKRASEQVERYFRGAVAPAAAAHTALFKALMAHRFGTRAAGAKLAKNAAELYRRIGWRLYEAAALELAGDLRTAADVFASCGAAYDAARLGAGQSRKLRRARFGARLTPRELEAMRLVLRGRSNGDIAHVLGISIRTVHHHVEASFSKLGIRGRWQLTEKHLERGGSTLYGE